MSKHASAGIFFGGCFFVADFSNSELYPYFGSNLTLMHKNLIAARTPSFLKIILYIFTKYMVFFIIYAFLDHRFKIIVLDKTNDVDELMILSFYYFVELIFASLIFTIILFLPIYFVFKLNTMTRILFAFLGVIILEYFVYETTDSYFHLERNGIINGLVSIAFFFVFFGKFIFSLRGNDSTIDKNIIV